MRDFPILTDYVKGRSQTNAIFLYFLIYFSLIYIKLLAVDHSVKYLSFSLIGHLSKLQILEIENEWVHFMAMTSVYMVLFDSRSKKSQQESTRIFKKISKTPQGEHHHNFELFFIVIISASFLKFHYNNELIPDNISYTKTSSGV